MVHTMAADPKKRRGRKPHLTGRARDTGKTRLVTFELDAWLDDAVEAFRYKDQRTKRTIVQMALKEFLTSRDACPAPPGTTG